MRHAQLRPCPLLLTVFLALGCTNSSGGAVPAADGGKNNGQGQSQEDGGEPTDGGSPGGSGGGSGSGYGAYWKQASAEVTVIDSASPTTFTNKTYDIPALVHDDVYGVDIDAYQQIKGGELVTYAFRSGDTVYYRTVQPLQDDGSGGYVLVNDTGTSHYYTLEDGALVDTSSELLGEFVTSSTVKFTPLTGAFPPAGWPSKMIEVKP
jgi:hypothetical protein